MEDVRLALKGPKEDSPGQRPGYWCPVDVDLPCKGETSDPVPPLQGLAGFIAIFILPVG